MAYVYRHFIPQNTAPAGTKRIGVYDGNGKRIMAIPLGGLTPHSTESLYSFGIVSDLHISHNTAVAWQPISKFDNALTLLEEKGCAFCIACGDLTNTGFYLRTDENTAGTEYMDEQQFAKYKEICDKHTIPVYEICGNHESYYGMPITSNLVLLETYTGKNVLAYTVTHGNELFILCGQPKDAWVMTADDYEWLKTTLAANTGKRCFVVVHSYIEEDSGDPMDFRENSIFKTWVPETMNLTNDFMNLLRQYDNVILLHGHSHTKFQCQELDENANYTERNGFKSVHVPSLGTPRDLNLETKKTVDDPEASQGYLVDVYDNCIVLTGMDFINNKPVPLGVYKINM